MKNNNFYIEEEIGGFQKGVRRSERKSFDDYTKSKDRQNKVNHRVSPAKKLDIDFFFDEKAEERMKRIKALHKQRNMKKGVAYDG